MKRFLTRDPQQTGAIGRTRLRLSLAIIFITLPLLAGCVPTVNVSGVKVPLDSTELVLTDKGLTDITKLARCKDLRYADLRGNDLSPEQIGQLTAALPECDVVWSVPMGGMHFDSNSESIAHPAFSADSAAMLPYFSDLQSVDASGSSDYAALKSAAEQYPSVDFFWMVTLGNQVWPYDATQIAVASAVGEPALERILSGLPLLEAADLTGTGVTPETAAQWQTQYPNVVFTTDVGLFGQVLRSDAYAIDLSNQPAVTLPALIETLPYFRQLQTVNLRGCGLTPDEQLALHDAFADVRFLWNVELVDGISADSADQELILSEHAVADPTALAAKLALLPGLKTVEMCNCGLTNEQMQALREQFPSVKFIWMIRVGDWEMRTDVRAFSMGNTDVFPGGRFLGQWYSRYREFTGDSLQPLQYCTDLIALDIGHSYNVYDLSNLAGLTKLQFLILAQTKSPDIEVVRNMPELVYLEIFSMQITDLSPLLTCTKLEYLNCSNCDFTSIDELCQLKTLKRLWVIKSDLTEEQVAQLKAALPDTVVMAEGRHPTDKDWRRRNPRYVEMQKLFNVGLSW
ncbi:MAG: leucine-rich repeat domain-containing protein [Clostridiales bacterium]|nr:leucine-rich repeat domain-containing protein [Clostridiales bacterium]